MEAHGIIVFKIILLASAVTAIALTVFCNALYDWGTDVARRLGWRRIVKLREKMKYWALPFSQIFLILLAGACLVAAFLI